jgi:hypothetical protein
VIVNRLILVTLLLATSIAHAQVMGAGGARSEASKATQLRAAVLGPQLAASPLLASRTIARRPTVATLPAPERHPQPASPQPATGTKGR